MGNPTIFGPQSPYCPAPAGSPPKSPFVPLSSSAFPSSAPLRRRRASLHVRWADGWEDPDRQPMQRDQIDPMREQHHWEQDGGHRQFKERRPSWSGPMRPVLNGAQGAPPHTLPINIPRSDSFYGSSPGQRSHMLRTRFEEMALHRHPLPTEPPITQRRGSFQDNLVPHPAAMQHLPHAVPSQSVLDLESPFLPDEPECPCQEQQSLPQRRPSWSGGIRPALVRPNAHPEQNMFGSPGQRSHIPRMNFEDTAPEMPPRPRRLSLQGHPIPSAPTMSQIALEPDESPFADEADRNYQDTRPGWPNIARPAMTVPHMSHSYSETYHGSPGQHPRSFDERMMHRAPQVTFAPPHSPFHSEQPLNPQPIPRHARRHSFDSNSPSKPPWALNPFDAPSTPSLLHENLGPVLHPLLDAERLAAGFYFALSSPYYKPLRLRSPADSSYATHLKSDLTLPATNPRISRVRIVHEDLPYWPVRIRNSHGGAITVNDVLRGVHHWLHTPVTHEEWARVAKDEGGQMRVARAFSKRWKASPDIREKGRGVKRIDYLWLWAKHGKRDIIFKGFVREGAGPRGEIWRLIVA
jgi:hypothetical protein